MMTLTESWKFWTKIRFSLLIKHLVSLLFLVVLTSSAGMAQDTLQVSADSTKVELRAEHSPMIAALLSTALPGGGQVYNKKYWKLPIVYAAIGGLSVAVGINARRYKSYRQAVETRDDGDSTTVDEFDGTYTLENLKTLKDYYRRNLDISAIFLFVIHALNIVDATVDAHLFSYDISDDLSLYFEPRIQPGFHHKETYGIALKLTW